MRVCIHVTLIIMTVPSIVFMGTLYESDANKAFVKKVLILRKWCKRKRPCFPVLCPTQISSTFANFKVREGRKPDSKFFRHSKHCRGRRRGRESEKSPSWKKLSDCMSAWEALTPAHGGKMAQNETNPILEILKSFNLGKCSVVSCKYL